MIGTLAAIWAVGFSINLLTLLALVVATGLVVDDAIVVIENIARHRALGAGPRAAAVLGTKEIVDYVRSLGVTTVELLPVHTFVDDSFLLGRDLLVVPVFSDSTGPVRRTYHLPAGEWRDLITGEVRTGPARVVEHVPLERIPLLARRDL